MTTKFDINQKVWAIVNNKPTYTKIIEIIIRKYIIIYILKVDKTLETRRVENLIFPTKEELIKSL